MVPALRAFHRKHFNDFGMVVGTGTGKAVRPLKLGFVKPHERLAYSTAHFTSLTTSGWSSMPTETKPLSRTSKMLLAMQLDKAQKETNEIITVIMQEEGLSVEEGWRVTPEGDATRDVPEQPTGPVIVFDAPADAPLAFTQAPAAVVAETA